MKQGALLFIELWLKNIWMLLKAKVDKPMDIYMNKSELQA